MRKLERGGAPLSAGAWGTRLGGSEVGPGGTRDKGRSLGMEEGSQLGRGGVALSLWGLYEMSGRHSSGLSLPSYQEVLDNRWSAPGIPGMASVLCIHLTCAPFPLEMFV